MVTADHLLALLSDGSTWTTADLIAACPQSPGWEVRRTLDRLAEDGRVHRSRGRRAGSFAWSLPPRHGPPPPFKQRLKHEKV